MPVTYLTTAGGSLTDDRLTLLLAECLGWRIAPGRYLLPGRRWLPTWRFQPAKRVEDAFRLLKEAATEEYTLGSEKGGFWARARIRGVVGEARDRSQARAIALAVACALGLEVDQ